MRKSPFKHLVKSHLRKGKRVYAFWRGHGLPRKAPFRQRTLVQYQNPNVKPKFIQAKVPHLTKWHPESQKIIQMDPLDFLKLTLPPARWDIDISDSTIDKLKEMFKKGRPIEPLWMDVDITRKKVDNHEGRHRALAAHRVGIEKVPVIVYYRDKGSYVDISQTPVPDIKEIKPQWG